MTCRNTFQKRVCSALWYTADTRFDFRKLWGKDDLKKWRLNRVSRKMHRRCSMLWFHSRRVTFSFGKICGMLLCKICCGRQVSGGMLLLFFQNCRNANKELNSHVTAPQKLMACSHHHSLLSVFSPPSCTSLKIRW